MLYQNKPISCCGRYSSIMECDKGEYEKDNEGTKNFLEKDLTELYKIVYSDNIEFSSPNSHQKRIYGSNLANDVINTLKQIPDIQV